MVVGQVRANLCSVGPRAPEARLDPGRHGPAAEPEHDPLPCERIDIQLVRPGARIEIRGALDPAPDPRGTGDYRSAAMLLTPRGVPRLVLDRG